jgi:oxygen-independent coproporphyrinogen-3 oxidase
MAVGIYISVPFCRSKCSFCNFASGVFGRERMGSYVTRLRQEIEGVEGLANRIGAEFERNVDSIYLGGGTPTTLQPDQLEQIFKTIHQQFDVSREAEVTIECAPGTVRPEIIETLLRVGVNRVSLGTQSFVDQEIRSVGRLHTAEQARADVARLRDAGIININLDLIAGLPHQNSESWRVSLYELANLQVPHASVYMLEVDEDSRLGRELIAGGERYHAHYVPDSDRTADLYLQGLEILAQSGLAQYEISNLCRPGRESRHNLKYWERQPYLGFGLDAHSMLRARNPSPTCESLRFSNTDDLDAYIAGSCDISVEQIDRHQALEESIFLQLRLNRGVDVAAVGSELLETFPTEIRELTELGLLERQDNRLRLTARGRLLSNEVFERFIGNKQIA